MKKKNEPMEIIKESMLDQIEIYLLNIGEFFPFGILLDYKLVPNNITTIDSSIEKSILENRRKIQELVCESCEYHSGGYCVDTRYGKVSRIQLNFISKNSEDWIQFYLPYKIEDGFIMYGEFESD